MRKIDELIWHCTATPEGREVSVAEITKWHKQRGWKTIGYHKVVHLDGSVSNGRPESEVGAHVSGHNTGTIGYVYVGGVMKDGKTAKDTRTPAQKTTMVRLTKEAIAKYKLKRVTGHHDYAAKDCPCFPAKKEYAPLLSGAEPATKPTVKPVEPPKPAPVTPAPVVVSPQKPAKKTGWLALGAILAPIVAAICKYLGITP